MRSCNEIARGHIDYLRTKMSLIGMKRKVLAKRIGVHPSHLSLIFNHKIMPSLLLYIKIKEGISSYYIENITPYENDNDSMELPF